MPKPRAGAGAGAWAQTDAGPGRARVAGLWNKGKDKRRAESPRTHPKNLGSGGGKLHIACDLDVLWQGRGITVWKAQAAQRDAHGLIGDGVGCQKVDNVRTNNSISKNKSVECLFGWRRVCTTLPLPSLSLPLSLSMPALVQRTNAYACARTPIWGWQYVTVDSHTVGNLATPPTLVSTSTIIAKIYELPWKSRAGGK